jgi:membrane protein implicated in regulation of membrane protease activity
MTADMITSPGVWAWFTLGLLLIGAELLAPGVFFIWLGLAAIATGLLDAVFGLPWQASGLIFAASASAIVILGRMIARSAKPSDPQSAFLNQRGQSLIGSVFTLEAPIKDGEGRIKVGDSSWRVTGADRFAGAKVRVVRIEGSTLVVDDP